jgi:hypothetical protein
MTVNPLLFHFYRADDFRGADGGKPDYRKIARAQPVESFKARTEAVFRMHLQHLGFLISRCYPGLEGQTLDVELEFQGKDGEPKIPVLVAVHEGRVIARRKVYLSTLDTSPFLALLLKRRPELKDSHLYYTVSPME